MTLARPDGTTAAIPVEQKDTWYVDLVTVSHDQRDEYVIRDLFVDLMIGDDTLPRMLDLDEIADACAAGWISTGATHRRLTTMARFLDGKGRTGRESQGGGGRGEDGSMSGDEPEGVVLRRPRVKQNAPRWWPGTRCHRATSIGPSIRLSAIRPRGQPLDATPATPQPRAIIRAISSANRSPSRPRVVADHLAGVGDAPERAGVVRDAVEDLERNAVLVLDHRRRSTYEQLLQVALADVAGDVADVVARAVAAKAAASISRGATIRSWTTSSLRPRLPQAYRKPSVS